MERRRAMFSRFLFYFIGGADNRRRGQREERTTEGEDNRRRGQQKERTTGGADSMSGGQLGLWREVCRRTAGDA